MARWEAMHPDETSALLDRARAGDEDAFRDLTAPHRRELAAHCYRILGSVPDADDAVQETMLAAWKGLGGFAGRSSLRTWLYTIATRASLRLAEQRPPRMLSWDAHPAGDPLGDLGGVDTETAWLDPWIEPADDPAELVEHRETISLAFLAALQRLPPNQRAVLILRDVLGFSAVETAEQLGTSVASVTSALQRARVTIGTGAPSPMERPPDDPDVRRTVDRFVAAFDAGDVTGIVELLTVDVRFTMPPLPAWFDGVDAVTAFFAHRSLVTPWRVRRRLRVNGCAAVLADRSIDGKWRPAALMVFTVEGDGIRWIASFLDPRLLAAADR
ncbi:RNA polymerase subunit sigma-70 [Raineyella sp. LH-20]|uniref:RNA polymerase subunit sigma-70 n=1 Tax=Raineyella sp. LH-20 TaxID=3081204 RepID=UPI0029546433|nr:RNA polymerase subunit sigma-70 [Raineyella sp. LH-20]WOP19985.1 RNA polymerase subunit sigma-70 [Raineyella sp. LH-20]